MDELAVTQGSGQSDLQSVPEEGNTHTHQNPILSPLKSAAIGQRPSGHGQGMGNGESRGGSSRPRAPSKSWYPMV